jgi:hypothetical protein
VRGKEAVTPAGIVGLPLSYPTCELGGGGGIGDLADREIGFGVLGGKDGLLESLQLGV